MTSLPRADLKVGFACNNRCVFCAQGEKRSVCDSLSLDELIGRLQQVKQGSQGLVLTGGEPTLYKRLPSLILRARELGYRPIQIQTNGRLLGYPEVLKRLLDAGAEEFSPSLHGSTAEIHDALTRAPGSFEQSVAGIANVAKLEFPVVTNSVITKSNAHDLPALVSLLCDLGVKKGQLAFVHPVGTAETLFDDVVPRLPDVVEPLRAAREIALRRGLMLVTEAIPYCFLRGMEDLVVEHTIPETTVIDLDGQVLEYSDWRVNHGKLHGPPCDGCARRQQCEGPWREYPAKFGWSEFAPVTESGTSSG